MRAFVITGPGLAVVEEVAGPSAAPGEVIVDVERAGVCGTDAEFFTGHMAYLATGEARYPMRIGHEWCGTVTALGTGVDPAWLGRRVTGDTMLGCGRCDRCRHGRHYVCADRAELGVRSGRPGALAERVAVPATSLHALPAALDPAAGALVEPGGNALRAVEQADLESGDRILILGTGTIGLLAGQFAAARGLAVQFVAQTDAHASFPRALGFEASVVDDLPDQRWDAVIDATNAAVAPALALDLVEPGRRVVLVGLSGSASHIDTRRLVLKDVTAVGLLGASPALGRVIDEYASGRVDPTPVVAATVGLHDVAAVLAGRRPSAAGPGPKVHVDPRE